MENDVHDKGKLSVKQARRKIKAEQDKRDLAAAQERIGVELHGSLGSVCDLRVCSCRELFASGIKPDAVITDPPYPYEFLSCFTELAEGCKLAGVPLVAVMSGQSHLPEVMRRLCEHLKYRWTLAYLTPGGQAVQQWPAKVNAFWKPVLLFGEARGWFGDVATSKPNDNDKRFHGWGQSESGMADLIRRLTKPGQLVCDPFLGGGTTAVAALALGRRFVGCDVNAECVETAKQRVVTRMGLADSEPNRELSAAADGAGLMGISHLFSDVLSATHSLKRESGNERAQEPARGPLPAGLHVERASDSRNSAA